MTTDAHQPPSNLAIDQLPTLDELVRVGSRWREPIWDYDHPDADGCTTTQFGADGQPAFRIVEVTEHWHRGDVLGVRYRVTHRTPGTKDYFTSGWSAALSFLANSIREPLARRFPADWALPAGAPDVAVVPA